MKHHTKMDPKVGIAIDVWLEAGIGYGGRGHGGGNGCARDGARTRYHDRHAVPQFFRTEPGFDLMIQGPPNNPVRGATPFSGLVETDWVLTSPAIHWQITEPDRAVRFRKGDAMAQIFPVRRGDAEAFEPEIRSVSDEPEIAAYMEQWYAQRRAFNAALKDPESEERRMKWPGHYRRGTDIFDKKASPETHRTRLRMPQFEDRRRSEPDN